MIKLYDIFGSTSRNLIPVIVSITHLLYRNKCTYDETDWIIEELQNWIKERRKCNEYATFNDYFKNNKTACMDDVVIKPMGLVDDNLNPILKDGTPFV